MTYIEWESEFKKCIKSIPEKEKDEIVGYYREMYSDRHEAGLSDEEIIKNFGEPMLCAAKILMENAAEENGGVRKEKSEATIKKPLSQKFKQTGVEYCKKISVSKIVGWFFLTVLFIIPLAAVVISAIAALASATVACAAASVSGGILAIASPFAFFLGYTGLGVLATAGAGLATAGVGLLLFEVFFFITKYSILPCVKILKHFFKRRSVK